MNVELFVLRLSGIKYLFKYAPKGRDRVTILTQNKTAGHDEIKSSIGDSYISTSEAAWSV